MTAPKDMTFEYDPALLAYMKNKKQDTIVVELVTAEHSDLEVSELYIHLVDDRMASQFLEKKRYRSVETAHGRVLFPPMALRCGDRAVFRLKKVLFVTMIQCEGIEIGR